MIFADDDSFLDAKTGITTHPILCFSGLPLFTVYSMIAPLNDIFLLAYRIKLPEGIVCNLGNRG
jgi:hypothetical protein